MGIGVAGELGVDGQPHRAAVRAGHPDGVLHPLGAARNGGHIGVVLFRGKDLFQNGSQLDLTQNTAGLHTGKHLFQPAHISGKVLHFAKTLVHLFQLVVHRLEAFGHPLLQRILQLFVHRMADLVQLLGVLGLQGSHALGKGAAHLFQLAGVGGFQPLQALLHGLLLGALPCGKGGAHALHRGLQRFTDVAHSGKVLLRHLCQLRVHLAVLRFQLLTQPFLPFCIVPVCGRLCRAVQQQGHHQADGHQKHRVKKR